MKNVMSLINVDLRWDFLDNFPKNEELSCLGGALKISASKFKHLKQISRKLGRNWKGYVRSSFSLDSSKKLTVGAGTVTSFFSVPRPVSLFAKKFPRIPLFFKRIDSSVEIWKDQFVEHKVDIMFGVSKSDLAQKPGYLRNMVDFSLASVYKGFQFDHGYLAASKNEVLKSSVNKLLAKGNILFGRLKNDFKDYSNNGFYFSSPKGREDENPRVIADHYFINYLLMLEGAGIWHVFSSFSDKKDFTALSKEPLVTLKRHVIFKKKLPKKFQGLLRTLVS